MARRTHRRAEKVRSAAGTAAFALPSAGAEAEPAFADLPVRLPPAVFPLFLLVVFRANRLSRPFGLLSDNRKVSQVFRGRETPNAPAKSIGLAP